MTFIVEYALRISEEGKLEQKYGEKEFFGQIVYSFVLPPICLLGILGNCLSGIVLAQKEMRSPVNCFFLGLAISNTVFLVAQFVQFGLFNFAVYFKIWAVYRLQYDPLLTPFWNLVCVAGQTSVIYFTLAITVDRFIAVCYPLRAKHINSYRRAVFVSFLIVLISIAASLPYLLGLKGVELPEEEAFKILMQNYGNITNGTTFPVYGYGYSDFGRTKLAQWYYHWGQTVFHSTIPFAILCVLNLVIAVTVRKSQKRRDGMSSSQKSEVSVAKILLCIVFVFGLCYLPTVMGSMLGYVMNAFKWRKATKNFLYRLRYDIWTVSEVTFCVSSATDFVIYCVMGNKFRACVTRLFSNRRRQVDLTE